VSRFAFIEVVAFAISTPGTHNGDHLSKILLKEGRLTSDPVSQTHFISVA